VSIGGGSQAPAGSNAGLHATKVGRHLGGRDLSMEDTRDSQALDKDGISPAHLLNS